MTQNSLVIVIVLVHLAAIVVSAAVIDNATTVHSAQDDDANFKVIEIENGSVRGKKKLTIFEKKAYYSFKGIPYGQAPIGELRFKVSALVFISPSSSSLHSCAISSAMLCSHPKKQHHGQAYWTHLNLAACACSLP